MKLTAQCEEQKHVVTVDMDLPAQEAKIFKLDGLHPASKYMISFQGVADPDECKGSFKTFNLNSDDFRVIIDSCDLNDYDA